MPEALTLWVMVAERRSLSLSVLSSKAVTVTLRALDQSAGVNVSEVALTVKGAPAGTPTLMVTFPVGSLSRTTV